MKAIKIENYYSYKNVSVHGRDFIMNRFKQTRMMAYDTYITRYRNLVGNSLFSAFPNDICTVISAYAELDENEHFALVVSTNMLFGIIYDENDNRYLISLNLNGQGIHLNNEVSRSLIPKFAVEKFDDDGMVEWISWLLPRLVDRDWSDDWDEIMNDSCSQQVSVQILRKYTKAAYRVLTNM